MASTLGVAGSFKEFGDMVGPLFIGALTQAFGLTVSFRCRQLCVDSPAVQPG
jgi:hypothetical protein